MFVAEFQEDIQITIPAISECLNDSVPDIRKAAIELFSGLVKQGMFWHHFLVGVLRHVHS